MPSDIQLPSKIVQLKFFAILLLIVVAIFFIEKINFPHPKNDIKQNITNEIIKLK